MIFDEDVIERLLGTEISRVFFRGYNSNSEETIEQIRASLDHREIAKLVADLEGEVSNIMGHETSQVAKF